MKHCWSRASEASIPSQFASSIVLLVLLLSRLFALKMAASSSNAEGHPTPVVADASDASESDGDEGRIVTDLIEEDKKSQERFEKLMAELPEDFVEQMATLTLGEARDAMNDLKDEKDTIAKKHDFMKFLVETNDRLMNNAIKDREKKAEKQREKDEEKAKKAQLIDLTIHYGDLVINVRVKHNFSVAKMRDLHIIPAIENFLEKNRKKMILTVRGRGDILSSRPRRSLFEWCVVSGDVIDASLPTA